jgi:two-component system cell cycle response regulator CtrA
MTEDTDMRVLAIGNRQWRLYLKQMLESYGFQAFDGESCEDAIELLKLYEYDALVIGPGLSHMPAAAAIRRLRAVKVSAPILVLLDDCLASSRVAALAHGADDSLSIPFDGDELCARLRAVVRRSRLHPESTIRIGNLEINLDSREVRVSGRAIHLTASEYRMLELLALRKGNMVRKETMFGLLYDGRDDPGERVINVFVCKLRKKIAAANQGESYITTAWGAGYRLCGPAPLAA